jgi:hypothetical protein
VKFLVVLSRNDSCKRRKWFREKCIITWKARSSIGDYHSQINLENYEKMAAGKIKSVLTTEF